MKYGVIVNGEFEERELIDITAKGFLGPMKGRVGTYDQYVQKEINKSYGLLECEGKVVLDIGANIGCFTKMALEKGATQVISLEPEPNNYAMLDLNTAGFHDRVSLHNAALTSTHDGEMELYLSTTGKNPGNSSTTFRRGRSATKINAISVDTLVGLYPNMQVAKIDCEGAEYEFFDRLMANTNLEQVALELHISGFGTAKAQDLHDFMMFLGFRAVREPTIADNLWQTLATYRRD